MEAWFPIMRRREIKYANLPRKNIISASNGKCCFHSCSFTQKADSYFSYKYFHSCRNSYPHLYMCTKGKQDSIYNDHSEIIPQLSSVNKQVDNIKKSESTKIVFGISF